MQKRRHEGLEKTAIKVMTPIQSDDQAVREQLILNLFLAANPCLQNTLYYEHCLPKAEAGITLLNSAARVQACDQRFPN